MKKLFLTSSMFFLLTGLLLTTSCLETDIDEEGFGDAYILVEIVGGDTLKGLGLHAYSYSDFSAVVANLSGESSQSYTLQPYLGYKQDFIWSTPLAQFKKELPAAGDYVFNATFASGDTHTFYDRLLSGYVAPPEIVSCVFTGSNQSVEVKWKTDSKTDSYNVKLMTEQGEILFVSPVYDRFTETYTFNKNTQGWQTSAYPTDGQNLLVEVSSYLLEAGGINNQLQSIGKSRIALKWGN